MSASKLVNLFALSTLAILLCSFAPSSTVAVSIHANHQARHLPNHHGIAKKKKKRDTCKPRPSSSSPPASSPTPGDSSDANNGDNSNPTSTPSSSVTPSSTPVSSTTTTSYTPSSTSTGNSGPGKLGIAWALGDDPRIQILLTASRVKIFHLWDVVIPSTLQNSGMPVSIMLWDTSQDRINNFVQYAKPGYATHAYGMNEYVNPARLSSLHWILTVLVPGSTNQPRAIPPSPTPSLLGTVTSGPSPIKVTLSEALAPPLLPMVLLG